MPNNKPYKVNRRRGKGHNLLTLLLVLFAAALCALLLALFWQDRQKNAESSSSAVSQSVPPPSSSAPAESVPSSVPPAFAPEEPATADGALPESAPVNSTYFDDAVFVGDSVTEGMLYCIGMENARILAGTSINFSTIYTAEVIKLPDGSRSTIMDELAKQPYQKVYVMLGGNEVRDQEKESFITRYGKVLDDLKAAQPDAIFYLQSMTPVTKNNNYNMSNERIDEFNLAVIELARQKGMFYLNVAESMKDADGMLPDEASPGDGMHFGQPYFDKWYAYLKTHVAPDSATSSQLADAQKPASGSTSSGQPLAEASSGQSLAKASPGQPLAEASPGQSALAAIDDEMVQTQTQNRYEILKES